MRNWLSLLAGLGLAAVGLWICPKLNGPMGAKTALAPQVMADFQPAGVRQSGRWPDVASRHRLLERAAAGFNYRLASGVSADRFVARELGEWRPVDDNHTPDGRQHNRRIEFGRLYGVEP